MEQPNRYRSNPREETEIVIYETAREIAVKVLNRIDRTDSYLDKVLDFELRYSELSRLDKSFLTELVNGTVRWKLRIDYVISQFYRGRLRKAGREHQERDPDCNVPNHVSGESAAIGRGQ